MDKQQLSEFLDRYESKEFKPEDAKVMGVLTQGGALCFINETKPVVKIIENTNELDTAPETTISQEFKDFLMDGANMKIELNGYVSIF